MKDEFILFNKTNSKEYLKLLDSFSIELDIYYNPIFLEIDAEIQGGEYEIFVFKQDKEIFIYPYIKLFFKEKELANFYDITSPYGYCGPFCSSEFLFHRAEEIFLEYISKNCITEFIRYHYIYNKKNKFSKNIVNLQNRTLVILDIEQSWISIWENEFSKTNRNLIRKMEKDGYEFILTNEKTDLDDFILMYYKTMNNVGASDFYYFKDDLINKLYNSLGEKILLFKIQKEKITYSYSLFFISAGIATYYLSARNFNFPKVPSTNYLLGKSVAFLKEKKACELVNFGGGLTNEIDDHLFKFKRNFSKDHLDFFIGKRIHNEKIYKNLIKNFIDLKGELFFEKRKSILQFYRN